MSDNLETFRQGSSSALGSAYWLLKQKGEPMHYSEIIEQILSGETENQGVDSRKKAKVYTEINLDYRLVHVGGGYWGLREWSPQSAAASSPAKNVVRTPRRDNRLRREESEEAGGEYLLEPEKEEDEDEEEEEDLETGEIWEEDIDSETT